ncbi:peroxiredoxin Q/BCP [Deinococcus hopiensis KR-140]|uniref:thioredoxin-dependent peroxiredoxin n=2 Tax=Deinococcus TaxID=1298 RepID=A0A1W1UQL8_9DEIO|nr:peroxiredoxin [Deinococcus hopiensis]SMB82994.1 peroxiredoxin Q/BCP [Deinococcus hopiensis KR-140]
MAPNATPALQTGEPAPDFTALDENGRPVTLSSYRGRWVVLFFFPRASTSHCQMQARRFQALYPEFHLAHAAIAGVSVDPRHSQERFRSACQLSFPLVADADQAVSSAYGVLGEPMPEEDLPVTRRETFLISPEGHIAYRWEGVVPNVHADEVLDQLREMQGMPLLPRQRHREKERQPSSCLRNGCGFTAWCVERSKRKRAYR